MSEDQWTVIKLPSHLPPTNEKELQELLNQAKSFYLAGNRCSLNIKISPYVTSYLAAPAIVCFTLSLELYLKLVLKIFTGTYPHEHKLVELLNAIPEEKMEGFYKKFKIEKETLLKSLDPISNAFIKWRYAHEENMLVASPEQIQAICENFHRFVAELQPSLVTN